MQLYLTFGRFPLAAILIVAFVATGCAYQPSISGFRPVYPPLTATFFTSPSNMYDKLNWPKVDSLQPTLRWKPFPGEHELPFPFGDGQVKPFITMDHASVSDVRYDLKIWTVLERSPEELAYDIEGLTEPIYKLERPLKSNTKYYWSVRARFNLDGQPRVSEWSLSQTPCMGPGCAQNAARIAGRIPQLNYYRFKTPSY